MSHDRRIDQNMNLSRGSIGMPINRNRLFIAGCSAALLLCLVGGIFINRYQKMVDCFKVRHPLKSFVLSIDRSQQKTLIEQSRKFSDKYGFQFDVAYFTPNREDFRIDMIRKDVEVVILNLPMNLDHYDVAFYNFDCDHPTVASDIEGLVTDLKSLIGKIPSAIITEEK